MDGHEYYDSNYNPSYMFLDNIDGVPRQMDKRYYPERCKKCKICADIYHGYLAAVSATGFVNKPLFDMIMKLDIRHDPDTHETAPPRTTHQGNGTHQGWFAGTLTMSPDDGKTEDDMVNAIEKIMKQKTCPVDKYAWYVEYTKAKLAHIHFIYITPAGTRIHKKVFQRYWVWDEPRNNIKGAGFRGGYHKPVDSLVAYKEYMSKDAGRHGGNISLEDI